MHHTFKTILHKRYLFSSLNDDFIALFLKFQPEFANPNKCSAIAFRNSEQKIWLKIIQANNMNKNKLKYLRKHPGMLKGPGRGRLGHVGLRRGMW